MKQTYIYRITDKTDASKVFYVYARNLPSAKEWLWSNKPEIKGRFEQIGFKKFPIEERAREFFLKYDQNEILSKLPIRADGNYLRFSFFESDCRVGAGKGMVSRAVGAVFADAQFQPVV